MRKLNLDEIHKYSLGCLCYFDAVCRKYNLKYSLAYGSLLGAVRHKGFIPWDDDVDVMMPREDYERLVEIFISQKEKSDIYDFLNERIAVDYYYSIGRVVDKRTKIKFKNNTKNVNSMGVFIDIYPLDKFSSSIFVINLFSCVFKMLIAYLFLSNNRVYKRTDNWGGNFIKYPLWLLTKITGYKFIFSFQRFLLRICPKTNELYNTWDNYKYTIPERYFDNIIEVDFAGKKIKAIADYHEFLCRQYGDYMQLPPKDCQVPYHEYDAFLMRDGIEK